MITAASPGSDREYTIAGDLARWICWLLWQCVRVPLFLLLVTLEPVVSLVLGSLALLGVLSAFFWKFVGPPHFSFELMISISRIADRPGLRQILDDALELLAQRIAA